MGKQAALWAGCALSLLVMGIAIWADRRRMRRADLDRVGWVPWPLVLITAMIAAAFFAWLGIKVR